MRMIQRGNRCGVGKGLNRGCVHVVVDDIDKIPAHNVRTPNTNNNKKSTKPTTTTLQQLQMERKPATAMAITITEWANQEHSHVGTLLIAQLANRDPGR